MHDSLSDDVLKKVAVGVSGGVDSAVTLLLLKQTGNYKLSPLFMQNWEEAINNPASVQKSGHKCMWQDDFADAKMVSQGLDLKLKTFNFVQDYWQQVFLPFLEAYKKGFTPNPDIWCNRFIKFSVFRRTAYEQLGCEYIATGHYAQVKFNKATQQYELYQAIDKDKDQTYFLSQLRQSQLAKTLFPIGGLLKSKVRTIASQFNLNVAHKKDSTGICFIGENNFMNFLKNYLPAANGNVVDIISNKVLKTHDGVYFYTIGQNKHLGLGGLPTPYTVVGKNIKQKVLYVASGKNNKYLQSDQATIDGLNWINEIPDVGFKNMIVRFRHRQTQVPCTIQKITEQRIVICYPTQRAVTPGQHAVFYLDNRCLGGGVVRTLSYQCKPMWWVNHKD